MPRLKYRVPKYGLHKASGQARVVIQGQHHLLGPYDSDESHERYKALIADLLANKDSPPNGPTVSQVCALFWRHAKRRYRRSGKGKFGAAINYRPVLRLARIHFGKLPASEFGPKRLKELTATMIAKGWSRGYINGQLGKLKLAFKWAVAEELVGVEVHQRLQAVPGLRAGDTDARETEAVRPVDDSLVEATQPFLPPHLVAMVRFQRLTGCRPGEVCGLTADAVDRSGEVWVYRPTSHKTRHHGKNREIYIGPKAQAILAPWLLKANEGRPVFATARCKVAYNSDSYRRAIHRACARAGLPRWSPNQLRHTAATSVRKAFDLEHAQSVLGHSNLSTTEIYAERSRDRAEAVARRLG